MFIGWLNSYQNKINEFIKYNKIKDNKKYSSYNFRTKTQNDNYEKTGVLPNGIISIYNDDAVRYIIENIESDLL